VRQFQRLGNSTGEFHTGIVGGYHAGERAFDVGGQQPLKRRRVFEIDMQSLSDLAN
jgi:hypothetical protein